MFGEVDGAEKADTFGALAKQQSFKSHQLDGKGDGDAMMSERPTLAVKRRASDYLQV